jgi:acetylornithine deacetylase/succinyl-diaminopimelate desuccinylase-like protein
MSLKISIAKSAVILAAFSFCASTVQAQRVSDKQLDQLTEAYFLHSAELLKEMIAVKNDAAIPEHVEANIAYAQRVFTSRGFTIEMLETSGIPLMLATYEPKRAKRTLLTYLHVDGQAVDLSKWLQPDPYDVVLKKPTTEGGYVALEWSTLSEAYDPEMRFFGRSTSDDKGPLAMFLGAWDALTSVKKLPQYGIKMIVDFEEEQGSPSLPEAVTLYEDKLKADAMLIFDGPRHVSNLPTLTFGARGIATITLETFGPKLAQHSGHYGNYAPNPALMLAQALASMKDERGRVVIKGFYDNVNITAEEKAMLDAVPDDEQAIQKRLGIARPDAVGGSYQESIQYPSLNIRGLRSAWVGAEVRTIVPATALAEIDVRLVPEVDPVRLIQLVKSHLESQGFVVLDNRQPTDEERAQHSKFISMHSSISYQAFRTPFDSEVSVWLSEIMKRSFDEPLVSVRMSGGSIPISPFVDGLGIDAVTIPTVNADNNQHSPNENLRVQNLKDGLRTLIAVLSAEPY